MLRDRTAAPARLAINGHPLHPMLIPLPIGLLVFAPITDIVYTSTKNMFWAEASWWLLLVGLITGAVAALAGLVDFVSVRRARSRTGWLHFIGNVVAIGVTFVNVLMRGPDHAAAIAPGGLILSLAVLAILAYTGWQGGELVYRHGIGVLPAAQPAHEHDAAPPPPVSEPPQPRAREARE